MCQLVSYLDTEPLSVRSTLRARNRDCQDLSGDGFCDGSHKECESKEDESTSVRLIDYTVNIEEVFFDV